jgi:hypothetical protein
MPKVGRSAEGRAKALAFKIKTEQELDSSLRWNEEQYKSAGLEATPVACPF